MGVTIDLQGTINSRSATAAVSAMRRAGAVVKRALVMDPGALVRLSAVGERSTDLFISTPLGCVASVRVPGQVGGSGTVAYASDALEAIVAFEPGQQTLDLGADMDLMWVGSPPPQQGFELIDTVPGDVVRGLHADMATENEANSGPMGIARSLLEQQVLTVQRADGAHGGAEGNDATASVALEGRTIAALGGLRLVPEPGEKLRDYDYVRVSASGSWIRVDALVGSVYAPRPGGLARVPGPR
ncbi:Uncharacterised protein [Corynebacterium jeikeium]|uniref:Uncharacterized protein n=1 Tax=Corynebacterium jeikeium (strain K411) TaxID=306537 RepID=Q4JWW2_CORJK|nr:hypothetical protein [Corynebacterium jeikeium]CAI36695.1 hypothetical protein jk0536 [Corynebacterium jeikeium K411]SUY85950.1 Uncharacterised protein [Corynebacterium jeikeium]